MGWSRRGILIGTAAIAAVTLGACGAGPAAPWDEPPDYSFEATIAVFGPSAGEWRITVRDHEVVEVEGIEESSSLSEFTGVDDFSTLAQYIERYEEAREGGAHSVTLGQAGDGTPTRYSVDWSADTLDDEYAASFRRVEIPAGP